MGIKFHFKWLRPVSPRVSADVAGGGLSIFDISRRTLPHTWHLYPGVTVKMMVLKNRHVKSPHSENNISIYTTVNMKKVKTKWKEIINGCQQHKTDRVRNIMLKGNFEQKDCLFYPAVIKLYVLEMCEKFQPKRL